jgi:cyclophilin family peptidyl-prolyl cis-trans isomerase
MSPVLAQLKADFPDDLRIIYRHFPLSGHDKAAIASQASEAAGMQGMFWEFHDELFAYQTEWSPLSVADFENWLVDKADELGLDVDQFESDLNSDEVVSKIQNAFDEAIGLEIPGTPFLLIDGQAIPSDYYSYDSLSVILENYFIPLGKLAKNQFSECPEITIDPDKQYTATIETDIGDIVVALYPKVAPFAVNSFIFLAENDFYDNVTFHRVIKGFMAQAGDPSGTGAGNPGYFYSIEVSPDYHFDREGLLALANAGPTSNGSQFFITYAPADHLFGNYTIFGEVLEGMDVVNNIAERDPDDLSAPPGNLILNVSIDVK